jgi:hypothetical protein
VTTTQTVSLFIYRFESPLHSSKFLEDSASQL